MDIDIIYNNIKYLGNLCSKINIMEGPDFITYQSGDILTDGKNSWKITTLFPKDKDKNKKEEDLKVCQRNYNEKNIFLCVGKKTLQIKRQCQKKMTVEEAIKIYNIEDIKLILAINLLYNDSSKYSDGVCIYEFLWLMWNTNRLHKNEFEKISNYHVACLLQNTMAFKYSNYLRYNLNNFVKFKDEEHLADVINAVEYFRYHYINDKLNDGLYETISRKSTLKNMKNVHMKKFYHEVFPSTVDRQVILHYDESKLVYLTVVMKNKLNFMNELSFALAMQKCGAGLQILDYSLIPEEETYSYTLDLATTLKDIEDKYITTPNIYYHDKYDKHLTDYINTKIEILFYPYSGIYYRQRVDVQFGFTFEHKYFQHINERVSKMGMGRLNDLDEATIALTDNRGISYPKFFDYKGCGFGKRRAYSFDYIVNPYNYNVKNYYVDDSLDPSNFNSVITNISDVKSLKNNKIDIYYLVYNENSNTLKFLSLIVKKLHYDYGKDDLLYQSPITPRVYISPKTLMLVTLYKEKIARFDIMYDDKDYYENIYMHDEKEDHTRYNSLYEKIINLIKNN